jgi:hypothetical protein
MAWRGVAGCPCCGRTLWTSRTKCGKKALRFVSLALRTPETSIVLVDLLHHFERFVTLSASVLINGHARYLLLLYRISDGRQKRNNTILPSSVYLRCPYRMLRYRCVALLGVPLGTPGYPLAGGAPRCRLGLQLECKLV